MRIDYRHLVIAGDRSVNLAERGHGPHARHPAQVANNANNSPAPEIEDDDLAGVHMGNVETVAAVSML